jgi:hypothetical protein
MHKQMMGLAICLAVFAVSAAAQTVNNIPKYSTTTGTLTGSDITDVSGNVGIGTTNPDHPLQIGTSFDGTQGQTSIFINAGGQTSAGKIIISPDGNEYAGAIVGQYFTNSTLTERLDLGTMGYSGVYPTLSIQNGNVGIGTTNPLNNIVNNTELSIFGVWTSGIDLGGNGASDILRLFTDESGNGYLETNTGSADNLYLGTLSTPRMTISAGGNVGIGTTTPAYPLDVVGVVNAQAGVRFPDGSTQTTAFLPANCGADYAEAVDVTGDRTKYEPGDVLVIDSKAPGKFLKSNQAYSTLVAGIYSTKPGFVGRLTPADAKTSASEVPMAMVGRVPTKVSAENGPIQAGDLLVTSSRMGYAMKGTDRDKMLGAVVGKALGSLDSGTGVIEVLVTLQ